MALLGIGERAAEQERILFRQSVDCGHRGDGGQAAAAKDPIHRVQFSGVVAGDRCNGAVAERFPNPFHRGIRIALRIIGQQFDGAAIDTGPVVQFVGRKRHTVENPPAVGLIRAGERQDHGDLHRILPRRVVVEARSRGDAAGSQTKRRRQYGHRKKYTGFHGFESCSSVGSSASA